MMLLMIADDELASFNKAAILHICFLSIIISRSCYLFRIFRTAFVASYQYADDA